jgi:hypothetical protein
MRRRIIFAGGAGLVILVCAVTFLIGKRIALAQLAAQPFLIQMEETTASSVPDGQPHHRNFFHAMRRDGSRAFGNFEIAPNGSWKMLARRLNLVPENKVARISDELHLISSYPMTAKGLEMLLTATHATTCALPGFASQGEGSFMGYRVLKFDRLDSDGKMETSQWLAPDLACHEIWGQLKERNAQGNLAVVTTQKAVYIYRGDPPAELFNIDPSYTEVPPSELLKRGINATGGTATVSPMTQMKLDRLDAAYKKRNSLP